MLGILKGKKRSAAALEEATLDFGRSSHKLAEAIEEATRVVFPSIVFSTWGR